MCQPGSVAALCTGNGSVIACCLRKVNFSCSIILNPGASEKQIYSKLINQTFAERRENTMDKRARLKEIEFLKIYIIENVK